MPLGGGDVRVCREARRGR